MLLDQWEEYFLSEGFNNGDGLRDPLRMHFSVRLDGCALLRNFCTPRAKEDRDTQTRREIK